MTRHVFTYGSLMFAPVWRHVVRGSYVSLAARLDNHARYVVHNELYPGLVAEAGAQVDGMLYLDIDDRDLAALDRFEGEDYRRCTVMVQVDGGRLLAADTYLYIKREMLSSQRWLPQHFNQQAFMQTWCRDDA